MPLDAKKVRDRINRFDENAGPLLRQLAAVIRDAINDGDLAAHEALPGEHEIADMAGLSRGTVRDAIKLLIAEGLLVSRSGQRTRVVSPPQVRRMSTERYQEALDVIRANDGVHPTSSAFTADHGVEWSEHNVIAHYQEGGATEEYASRLKLAQGAQVLYRELHKQIRGETVQLQTSVIPLELVQNTPVADPERQPFPGGTVAELYSVGLIVTRVLEEVLIRQPTPPERRELSLETAGPVMEVTRVFYVGERPVECSIAVVDAMSYRLSFETELS